MHAFLIRFRRRTFHVLSFRSSRYSIRLTRSSHEKFRSLRTESWCKYCWILIEMADQKKTRRSKIEGDGKRVKEAPSPTRLSVFPYHFNSRLLWPGAWGEPEKSTLGEGVDRSCYAHLKHIFEILMNNHLISWQHEIYLQNVEIFISVFKHVCTFQELF